MNELTLQIAAALLVGYLVGARKRGALAGPTAHNTTTEKSDWWSYAGSWN